MNCEEIKVVGEVMSKVHMVIGLVLVLQSKIIQGKSGRICMDKGHRNYRRGKQKA